MVAATGKVIVRRNSDADIKMRALFVRLDDGEEQTLMFGSSYSFEATAGPHVLRATNRLYTQKHAFDLSAGGEVSFEAANVPGGCFIAFMVLGGTGAYRVVLTPAGAEPTDPSP